MKAEKHNTQEHAEESYWPVIVALSVGSLVAGISTSVLTGSGTTMTLTTTGGQRDFVSYFVHYTGGTNTTASSYQVYATKNGGYAQST